jgi:hypothetical protein
MFSYKNTFSLLIPRKVSKKCTSYHFHFLQHLPHITDFNKGPDEPIEHILQTQGNVFQFHPCYFFPIWIREWETKSPSIGIVCFPLWKFTVCQSGMSPQVQLMCTLCPPLNIKVFALQKFTFPPIMSFWYLQSFSVKGLKHRTKSLSELKMVLTYDNIL